MRTSKLIPSTVVLILLVLLLPFASRGRPVTASHPQNLKLSKALKGLPFCVLVLWDGFRKFDGSRQIHMIVESSEVTETNLSLLFKVVSEQCPESSLAVWVYTDVEQLAALSTGMQISGEEKKSRHQLAYYKKTDKVELFRYNPNYPEEGMTTVLLRGRE